MTSVMRTIARAENLLDLGRTEEALQALSEHAETATSSAGLVTRARALHRLQRYQEGLDAAGAALATDPDNVGGWLMQALCYLGMELPVQALPPARRALELRPDHYGSHQVMARVLADLGRLDAAIHHAQKTIELDPDGTAGWVTLCRVHLSAQRWHDAEMSAKAALARDPECDEAKVLLGVAQATGRGRRGRADAMDTFVATLRNNPDQEHVRKILMEVAWGGGPGPVRMVIGLMIAIGTGGALLVVLPVVWTVIAYRRWSTVPPDARRLIWADRKARRQILVFGGVLAVVWLVLVAFAILIVVGALA